MKQNRKTMKKTILICIMPFLATMTTMADSEVMICANNATAENTTLTLPQGKLTGSDNGGILFKIKGQYSGYCQLDMGRMSKLIYIEDGGRLTVNRNLVTKEYVYKGKGAAENDYLASHEYERIILKDDAKNGNALNDSIKKREDRLETEKSLSATFRRLEALRQRYGVLNAFYRQTGWDSSALPQVAAWMEEHPELWMTQAYRSFYLDALYTIGMQKGGKAIHDYTNAELHYAADNIADATLRDLVAHHVMTTYMTQRGANDADDLMSLYLSMSHDDTMRSHISDEYRLWEKVKRGSSIPDFAFGDTQGNKVKLSDLRGKYVLIDCWATWCGPCKAQLPQLEKTMERYAGKNIVFVSISSDKKRDAWLKMVNDRNMKGIQLNEPDAEADFFTLFRVNAIPRFILLAPDGTVQDSHLPRPSDPALSALLDELVGNK